jgi:glycerophosphoryl diester phosphodiesterase
VIRENDLIIAHRGESFDAPENTLASIKLAWEKKISAVETDIHLTRDNEIVVIHDYDTKRISGIKKVIMNSSLKELKLIDAGTYKGSQWRGERIPTLDEVLQTVPEKAKIIIEIKSDEKILPKLKTTLSRSNLKYSQIEIITFRKEVLKSARLLMPEYKMLLLLNLDYFWPWWTCRVNIEKIIKMVRQHQFNGVDVWAGKLLTKEFIRAFKDAGLLVYAWTVDDPVIANILIGYGIDGITTNSASWMTAQLHDAAHKEYLKATTDG